MNEITLIMSARKIICNCCLFLKSAIFKIKLEKKLPSYFQSTSTNNTWCVIFSIKKSFSPLKIGRFLGKNRVKNMFFIANLSKKYIFRFSQSLHRVERTQKHVEKLI